MPNLLLATSNAHKTAEVAAMLGGVWNVRDMRSHPGLTLPEETGVTFEENAVIKARGGSVALPGMLVLADDSGLEVDALGGEPGVWSARYAGPGADDAANRALLKERLAALAKSAEETFPARFRCCLALVKDGAVLHVSHGAVEGSILLAEQGTGGFGYDALFVPEGHEDSFGVLPAEVKNQLSHRARALEEMRRWLETLA